jgi:hypothetical protein
VNTPGGGWQAFCDGFCIGDDFAFQTVVDPVPLDNCPFNPNAGQADDDGDGAGNLCDAFPADPNETTDTDGDGVGDNADLFPSDPGESADIDGDGIGDNADTDDDNDGIPDTWEINHGLDPYSAADAIVDADGDSLSNLDEFLAGSDPYNVDSDGDLITDDVDNCPIVSNANQFDSNGDGIGTACKPVSVVSFADINGNGFSELAIVVRGGSNHVHIRDGDTGDLISDINFGDDPVAAIAVVDDISGNGMPEIALLGTRPSNNVRVQVKDSVTGAVVNNIFYGSAYSAADMTVLPDTNSNGADELMVVGTDVAGGVRVQARDTLTDSATSTTYYGNKVPPQDVLVVPDVSANAESEVLMHGRVTANFQGRAQMRDTSTKALVRNFFFGTSYVPIELAVIGDVSGDGIPDLAQLARRDDTGATRILVKRTDTGATVSTAYTGSTDIPVAVVGIGDANGNSMPDVALLVQRPDATAKVVIRDGATGVFIRNIFAGAVSNPVAMTLVNDLDSSGDPELAILGDDNAGTRRVQIKDSISGAQVNTIDFP